MKLELCSPTERYRSGASHCSHQNTKCNTSWNRFRQTWPSFTTVLYPYSSPVLALHILSFKLILSVHKRFLYLRYPPKWKYVEKRQAPFWIFKEKHSFLSHNSKKHRPSHCARLLSAAALSKACWAASKAWCWSFSTIQDGGPLRWFMNPKNYSYVLIIRHIMPSYLDYKHFFLSMQHHLIIYIIIYIYIY